MGYFAEAAAILIQVVFGLVTLLFVVRVLLQLVRANFYNPICQFFYKATNPVLMPLRKLLPAWRGFDFAASLIAYLLQCLKVWFLVALAGRALGVGPTLVLGVAEVLMFVLGLYFILILVRVVLSWIAHGGGYHPMVPLIAQLTEPVLRPLRRILPQPGGFDLSPLVASVAILLAQVLIVAPLRDLGAAIAGA